MRTAATRPGSETRRDACEYSQEAHIGAAESSAGGGGQAAVLAERLTGSNGPALVTRNGAGPVAPAQAGETAAEPLAKTLQTQHFRWVLDAIKLQHGPGAGRAGLARVTNGWLLCKGTQAERSLHSSAQPPLWTTPARTSYCSLKSQAATGPAGRAGQPPRLTAGGQLTGVPCSAGHPAGAASPNF